MKGLASSFIFVLCMVICHNSQATDEFIFEDCGGEDSIGTISNFVLPSPISLSKEIEASVDLTFNEDVPEGALVKANFYKVKYLFGLPINVPIPCIMGHGSCTTEHCEYLKDAFDTICPFFPEGHSCNCPIKAGNYKGAKITLGKPQLGPLATFLAKGHFKYEFRILSKDSQKELFCGIFTGKLAA